MSNYFINLEEKALNFATLYHGDQKRKYVNEPYIVHPIEVAKIVKSVPHTEAMVCAALLHDVVEDTPATIEMVKQEFGDEIATLVEMLTDISKKSDGNRKIRKEIDRQHSALANSDAKTIKLADIIHNANDIIKKDPNFSIVFLDEAKSLLEVLKEGNQELYKIACEIVRR